MVNVIISPNMNLPIPVPGVDPGVDWANNIVADMNAIDSHNHTAGQGVPIPPGGLNINTDLPMGGNNLVQVRSVNFTAQGSPLAAPADLGCVYVSGVDLYYNDEDGNQVRITQGGTVTGATGTITGLPSGTASASFAAGAFTFQSATNTPATMNVGPLVIGRQVASSPTVTLAPNSGQGGNFSMTLPAALPASPNFMTLDSAGNISFDSDGYTGTGPVVLANAPTIVAPTITGNSGGVGIIPRGAIIATFPNFAAQGAFVCTATTIQDAFGWVLCNGQTIVDGASAWNGSIIPNLNNNVFLMGSTTSNTSGGSNTIDFTHAHNMSHYHQWGYFNTISNTTYTLNAGATGVTTITTSSYQLSFSNVFASGVVSSMGFHAVGTDELYYTTGALGAASGTSGNTANTGTALGSTDVRPSYISAVYIMRIG